MFLSRAHCTTPPLLAPLVLLRPPPAGSLSAILPPWVLSCVVWPSSLRLHACLSRLSRLIFLSNLNGLLELDLVRLHSTGSSRCRSTGSFLSGVWTTLLSPP